MRVENSVGEPVSLETMLKEVAWTIFLGFMLGVGMTFGMWLVSS